MGVAAGIDLVEVDEVRAALAAHGERYLERVFTVRERSICGDSAARLAGALAAKEATFKALAVPADAQAVWTEVEIEASGAQLHGALRRAHPDAEVTVSTSVGARQALAVAIVEGP